MLGMRILEYQEQCSSCQILHGGWSLWWSGIHLEASPSPTTERRFRATLCGPSCPQVEGLLAVFAVRFRIPRNSS